jgi:bacillithiol system protein YtxJ
MNKLDKIRIAEKIIIFKFSPSCPISLRKESEFDDWVSQREIEYVKVNVISERDISNKIAEIFNIKHESPQIIFIENGKPAYFASHYDIDLKYLESLL